MRLTRVCAAITQVGPNSILQVSVLCDRIRSRNTKHPSLVSTSLPHPLLPVDSLFSLLTPSTSSITSITSTSSTPAISTGQVWREMAARGDLTLQALGVDINSQVVSFESKSEVSAHEFYAVMRIKTHLDNVLYLLAPYSQL